MASLPVKRYSPEEYFQIEKATDYKNEYFHGEIFAMAGASPAHNRIVVNLISALAPAMKDRPCEIFGSDTRVKVSEAIYTYPDLSAVCGEAEFTNHQLASLINPLVIMEVLSPSTEAFDRGEKFANYRRISSLRQYVLISQDRMLAESYVRQADNQWLLTECEGTDGMLDLPSVGQSVSLKEIYARVSFASDSPTL